MPALRLLCSPVRRPRVASWLPLVVGLALPGTPMNLVGQVRPFVGLSVLRGSIETPYFFECYGDGRERAGGGTAYLGVEVNDVSVAAEYVDAGEDGSNFECRVPPPLPDGTYSVREYPRRSSHIWGWGFHLRYRVPQLPAIAYVGVGRESEGNRFVLFGAEVRSSNPLAFFAGAQAVHFRTPFIVNEETWDLGAVVSSVGHTNEGHAWRRLLVFRVGVEYTWTLFK